LSQVGMGTKFSDYCDPVLFDESLLHEQPKLIRKSLQLRNEYNSKIQEFGKEKDYIIIDMFGRRRVRWNTALITKAKAWYAVSYASAFRSRCKFRSFPWIVWDVLLAIKYQIALMSKQPLMPRPRLINPLSVHLTAALESFCASKQTAYNAFVEELSFGSKRLDAFVQYSQKYGPMVPMLCFVLDNWLEEEKVYERSALQRVHIVILLLQFSVGILHGKHSSNELYKQPIYFEKLGVSSESQQEGDAVNYNAGDILFAFLRYLASEQFAHAKCIHFGLGGMSRQGQRSVASVLTRFDQWAALHAVTPAKSRDRSI
uniref:RNA-dependent RNA polymerase n=1 Tax=Gongylonema pulchrum TaxID=637853 RepID=A0A183E5U4_9BILA